MRCGGNRSERTRLGVVCLTECDLVANLDELYVSVCAAVLRLSPLQV